MKRLLVLACALALAVPLKAHAQQNAVGNDANPTAPGGMRLLGRDGVSDRGILTDAGGRIDPLTGKPVMELINHKSNITLAAGTTPDTTFVPFQTDGYRQMFALVRIKAASFAATNYLELGVRSYDSASTDSTALGWPIALGTGTRRGGKVLRLTTLDDRWKMVALSDSISGVPYQAKYTGLQIFNFTGSQVIYDVWLLGVR